MSTIETATQLGRETAEAANKQWGDWLTEHPMSNTHKTARNMSMIAAGHAMGEAGIAMDTEEGLAFVKAFLEVLR